MKFHACKFLVRHDWIYSVETGLNGCLMSRLKDWYKVQCLRVLWRIWWKTANWTHTNLYVVPTGNQRDFKEGHVLSIFLHIYKKVYGTYAPLIAMTNSPELVHSCPMHYCDICTDVLRIVTCQIEDLQSPRSHILWWKMDSISLWKKLQGLRCWFHCSGVDTNS